ncbi:MAG: hypothetical protein OEM67_11420 [Thermoleophilia bacterium]|nr:hypothetical protein [Thermoleophilia bacterium]
MSAFAEGGRPDAAQMAFDLLAGDQKATAFLYALESTIGTHAVDPLSVAAEHLGGLANREEIRRCAPQALIQPPVDELRKLI